MATMTVKNAAGADETVEKPLAPGRAAAASSRPVALSNEDFAVLDGLEAALASILAKILAAPATEAKQDTIIGHVDGIEASLASILAKLSADPATQTTLAAILASMATAANQTDANALLTSIAGSLSTTSPAVATGLLDTVAVTPTVTAGAYSTGMVIGGVMTFADILRGTGESGFVVSARVTTKVANTVQIDVFIFNAAPGSGVTDHAAFALADADRAKLKGVIQIQTDDWVSAGTPSIGYREARVPVTGAAADDIYAVMVIRGAHTPGSTSDLTVELTVDQN